MRAINHIVNHCTATSPNATVEAIVNYWKRPKSQGGAGWKNPGYHYLIEPNGRIHYLHPIEQPSNGVRGHNHDSIHIAYIGGIDENGKPLDTRTPAQVSAMLKLLIELVRKFPKAKVLGHRDFDGVSKACPSFDVEEWLTVTTQQHF